MTSKYNWERMPLEQRLVAAGLDITRHPEFSMMGGVVCTGGVIVDDSMPTAATDGFDCWYGRDFMMKQNMEQVRWVVLHENFHKALKHCVTAQEIRKKYPRLANKAMDYEINLTIYDMDPAERFALRPAGITICFDEKYRGMGWMEILRQMLKDGRKEEDEDGGGDGKSGSFDEHRPGKMSPAREKQISDALSQGHIIAKGMGRGAGAHKGGSIIDKAARERHTDWREHLRQFVSSIVAGDDLSRFCPPNKRMMPLGFVMPSHFSESSGGFIVAADTSGSMATVYPTLFGEIAQICKTAHPEYLRLLWWDGAVQDEQFFKAESYDNIGKLLAPKGGGGTDPTCVVRYINEKQYKPKAIIWLTDGDFYKAPLPTQMPQLWGVVDNPRFTAPQGKVLHINSLYN